MCGIFGALNLESSFSIKDENFFKELTNKVSYRGPDGVGYLNYNTYTGQPNSNDFNIFLGHRRLSIIDLTPSGAQPMSIGNYRIIFNGEIYNYIELRNELKLKGHNFKTDTDTEVIIKVYEQYGSLGFSKLNGMWAFAILDLKANKVILSRDRFGEKPLFYFQNDKCFFFSSEIKQLIPLFDKIEPNRQVIYKYLKQGLIDYSNETFFRLINRVESKTNLTIDLKSKTISNEVYWSHENFYISKNNTIDEFRFLLEDSVKLRLRSDVPVGCMLSGGLDSSAITLFASRSKSDIETFSVISDDKKANEEPFIDIMTEKLQLKNWKMNFNSNLVVENFENVIFHQDEPFFNLSVLASYSILKKIKTESDIVVLLNGQGGDELLMGYLKYFFFYEHHLLKKGDFVKASSLFFSAIFNRTIINQFKLGKAKRYIPGYLNRKSRYLVEKGDSLIYTWSFESMRERQILDIDKYSIPALCRYEDRNSTAHSLEMRVPFLDHRLVSFCLNLDNDFKIKNGWTKYLLRKALYDLPRPIRYRRDKKGFSVPEEKFLKEDLNEKILTIGHFSILDEIGLINKKEFIAYYKQFLEGKTGFLEYTDITRILIAEMWARRHFS